VRNKEQKRRVRRVKEVEVDEREIESSKEAHLHLRLPKMITYSSDTTEGGMGKGEDNIKSEGWKIFN